jgi:hypothetical protein
MSWETPVPIFEDEDEDALISEFVRLSAQYDHIYSPQQIAVEVFKNLRDPTMRANQAATVWSSKLEIAERIRKAKQSKDDEDLIQSKEQWEKHMLALLDDPAIGTQEKKVRMEIYNSIAKSRGWLEDDSKNNGKRNMMPQFIFGIDPRSQNAA